MAFSWIYPNWMDYFKKSDIVAQAKTSIDVSRAQQTDTTGYIIISHHNYITLVQKSNPETETDTIFYSTNGCDTTFYVAKDVGVGNETVSNAYSNERYQAIMDSYNQAYEDANAMIQKTINYTWFFVISELLTWHRINCRIFIALEHSIDLYKVYCDIRTVKITTKSV
jgi:hypothetical protein